MELLYKFLENFFLLASAMSFYILLGLIIAGVLKQIVPSDFVSKHLGKSSLGSVVKATIFGIPLPVCSCSVIPLAKSLQKEGASRGAVQSFLISTPITGVDSIAVTYSFFGWIFTIYRVITSVIIAITVGIIENTIGSKERIKDMQNSNCECSGDVCEDGKAQNSFILNNSLLKPHVATASFSMTFPSKKSEDNSCDGDSCCSSTAKGARFSIKAVFNYAFNTLFKDIAKSLLVGLILGSIFTTFLPKEMLATIYDNRFLTYIMVLIVAMPLYVCATASLPIAAAFVLSGMSAGGAFVFLSAGPATNTVTMGVVAQMFGKKSLAIYIGVIAVLSIIFGYIFDTFFGKLEVLKVVNKLEQLSTVDTVATVIMLVLIAYYILKRK